MPKALQGAEHVPLPEPEQQSILETLGEGDVEFEDETVPATWLVGEAKPSAGLVESVKRFGILSPLLVRRSRKNSKNLIVIDGRRRLGAVSQVGIEEIPVRIISGRETILDPILVLQTNNQRSSNPVSELQAIEKLVDEGAEDRDLTQATGLTKQQVTARLRLRALHPALREAWEAGKMGLKGAEAAARLDPQKQEKLLEIFDENDKITTEDVYEVRKVGVSVAVDSLDDEIFAQIGMPTWEERVESLLEQAVKIVPESAESEKAKKVTAALLRMRKLLEVSK